MHTAQGVLHTRSKASPFHVGASTEKQRAARSPLHLAAFPLVSYDKGHSFPPDRRIWATGERRGLIPNSRVCP